MTSKSRKKELAVPANVQVDKPVKAESFERPEDKDFPYHVCIKADCGQDIWLVPERTGKHEWELTPADIRMLFVVQKVFPGAKVEELVKR
jgi:hypothetical protein